MYMYVRQSPTSDYMSDNLRKGRGGGGGGKDYIREKNGVESVSGIAIFTDRRSVGSAAVQGDGFTDKSPDLLALPCPGVGTAISESAPGAGAGVKPPSILRHIRIAYAGWPGLSDSDFVVVVLLWLEHSRQLLLYQPRIPVMFEGSWSGTQTQQTTLKPGYIICEQEQMQHTLGPLLELILTVL